MKSTGNSSYLIIAMKPVQGGLLCCSMKVKSAVVLDPAVNVVSDPQEYWNQYT